MWKSNQSVDEEFITKNFKFLLTADEELTGGSSKAGAVKDFAGGDLEKSDGITSDIEKSTNKSDCLYTWSSLSSGYGSFSSGTDPRKSVSKLDSFTDVPQQTTFSSNISNKGFGQLFEFGNQVQKKCDSNIGNSQFSSNLPDQKGFSSNSKTFDSRNYPDEFFTPKDCYPMGSSTPVRSFQNLNTFVSGKENLSPIVKTPEIPIPSKEEENATGYSKFDFTKVVDAEEFVPSLQDRNPATQCKFCQNNGEPEAFYSTHVLKGRKGRIICPVLRRLVCDYCGATGSYAHTRKYCKYRKLALRELPKSSSVGRRN